MLCKSSNHVSLKLEVEISVIVNYYSFSDLNLSTKLLARNTGDVGKNNFIKFWKESYKYNNSNNNNNDDNNNNNTEKDNKGVHM